MCRHRVLIVKATDGVWCVDVGIGEVCPRYPLELKNGLEQEQFDECYRFDKDPFLGWVLMDLHHGEWRPFYSFTEEPKLMEIMLAFSSVWRFMLDRTAKDRRFAFVSEDDMQNLQYMLGRASNPVLITADSLKVGQKVRVVRGALASLEGWYYKEGHASFIVIKVTMGTSHYVYTEVPIEDIKPL